MSLARVTVALLAVILLVVLEVVATMILIRDLFLTINVVYWDTFIVVPACALALVIWRRRLLGVGTGALVGAGLLLAPLGYYATFVEPRALTTETCRVPLERAPTAPLRVAVLADLQFRRVTDHERAAVRRALDFDPHLIVLPGDLLQVPWSQYFDQKEAVRELLAPLQAPLGVYFVQGNVEPRRPGMVEELLEGTAVRYLLNDTVELEFDSNTITLAGIDLSCRSRPARAVLSDLEDSAGSDLRILLSHRPDVCLDLGERSRIDLVISGHTHGGQVNMPLFGPPITLSAVPREVAAGGLHELGTWLYVSRGIGCERGNAPPVRFNAPPEVTWLTLERPAD